MTYIEKSKKLTVFMAIWLVVVITVCGVFVSASPTFIDCRKMPKKYMTLSYPKIYSTKSSQDCFVSGGLLYKFWNPGVLQIYDFKTGKLKLEKMIDGGHCSVATYAKGKMYLETNQKPPVLKVHEFTGKSTKYVKSLQFPKEKYGYIMKHVVDSSGKYIYGVAYKRSCLWKNSEKNGMVISVWDNTKLTKNSNGTYTPKFVKSFNVSFFPFMQGMCFDNGKIYILTADYEAPRSKVFVVDVNKNRYAACYCNFPDEIKKKEAEGVFVYGNYLYIDTGKTIYRAVKIK